MKRINKHSALLSKLPFWGSCGGFLFSLLLLLVTACSDEGREMAEIQQGADEVELTIRTEISVMKNNARSTITDAVNTIVALAFDEGNALIKKVDAVLTKEDNSTSGTLKIKVPKRTRTIHFLGNYTKHDITDITTIDDLKALTTGDMATIHYWGMTNFDGTTANLPVILYRNMAKVKLTLGEGLDGHIAGFVNYNTTGTVVPNGFTVGDTPTIPTEVDTNTHQEDNSLDTEHYLFEHANTEDNPLYVILEVADKYYKVAFAAGDDYFPIIRNNGYTITITDIDEMYGEDYETAINESTQPINDLVITETNLTVTPSSTEVLNESGKTFTVTVTIPDGITELNVPTHDAFTITPPDGLTAQDEKYTVTPENSYAFTFAVIDGLEAGNQTISFSGRGKYKRASGSATVTLVDEEEPDNTPYEITLDFYTNDSGQDVNGTTYTNSNLTFGVTDLYLKAIVPDNVPVGTSIVLGVDVQGRNGIHEYYSYNSDDVVYDWDSHRMTITKKSGVTDYIVRWRFVRSDNTQTADVNVIYSLTSSDETLYTLSGETSANITITGNHEKQITVAVNGGESLGRVDTSLEYTKNATDQLSVIVTVPEGVTELTIEPGDFDVSWTDANENTISGTSFTFATGVITQDFTLTLKEASKVVKENSIVTFRYAPDRFVAAGVVAVDLTEKVVDDAVVFDLDFNSGDEGFYKREDGSGSVSASDGALVLKNTEDRTNAWDAQAMYATDDIEYGATYTLTFKAKIDEGTTGGLIVAIQHIVNNDTNYTYFYSGNENVQTYIDNNKNSEGWAQFSYDIIIRDINNQETPNTNNPTHFMFNFGDLVGTIYIDDLKLVKND